MTHILDLIAADHFRKKLSGIDFKRSPNISFDLLFQDDKYGVHYIFFVSFFVNFSIPHCKNDFINVL